MGRSTDYYRSHPDKAKAKSRYDSKLNSAPSQVKKRVEANRARRRAKAKGKDVRGLDASHTKNGIVFKPSSVNRGSRGDGAGDRRSRGGKSL